MSGTVEAARPHPGRRLMSLAGGALAVSAAVAIPAVAQSGGDQPEPVVVPETVVDAPRELAPQEQIARWHAEATPEEKAAFLAYVMTPEQRVAFTFFVATPEQREAFIAFVSPPPPPPAPPARPVASSRGGSTGTNGFLQCVKQRESRGNYGAVNSSSGAAGAYQFMPGTWNATARRAGRPDLVGRNPATVSPADQDAMAMHLYQWQGSAPWGGGC